MPITLFHRHDLSPDGSNPLLVNVYGAYGTDIEMDYSPEKIVLLERGWIVAYCHVRLVQVCFFSNSIIKIVLTETDPKFVDLKMKTHQSVQNELNR